MATIKVMNYELYYESYGEGEPLIFLNGIMMSAQSWRPFKDSFKGYKLILLDLIDQGGSSKGKEFYDQSLHVEIIKEFIDNLGFEKVHLFGISYGGEVAQRFALTYSYRLHSLSLSNTNCYTNNLMKDIERLWDYAASTYDGHVFFKATMPFIYSYKYYEEKGPWLKAREELFCKVFTKEWYEGFRRAIKSASTLDLREEIKNISLPTLIIGSTLDTITPLPYQEEIYSKIKGSKFLIIKDAGHASMYEKPQEFASILKGFLDSLKEPIVIV